MHKKVKKFVLRWNHPLEETSQERTLTKMALILDELGPEKVAKIYNQKVKKRFDELIPELGLIDKRFKNKTEA
jgi:hypothetical protein